VDQLDREVLDALRADGRLSMVDLGRRVGLSRTAVLARVRRLERDGTIRGYHADVAVDEAADHVARVAVVLSTPDVAGYVRRVLTVPEVTSAESLAGEYDLLVRVAARTAADLDRVLNLLTSWRETVRTTSFVVLSTHTRTP